jgi:hypothetical protein
VQVVQSEWLTRSDVCESLCEQVRGREAITPHAGNARAFEALVVEVQNLPNCMSIGLWPKRPNSFDIQSGPF